METGKSAKVRVEWQDVARRITPRNRIFAACGAISGPNAEVVTSCLAKSSSATGTFVMGKSKENVSVMQQEFLMFGQLLDLNGV